MTDATVRISDGPLPRGQRVYLVGQDTELAGLLNDLWWPGSMEVTVFPRGKPALERILLDPPDLLILEQRLPDTT
ncbi:MAG: hypothetical protein AB7D57_14830, partial [Desulfovibrionaceae bacterium]